MARDDKPYSIYSAPDRSAAARHFAEVIALAHEARGESREAANLRRFADSILGTTFKQATAVLALTPSKDVEARP